MAFFAPENEHEVELLEQHGGKSASTIKKKENVLRQFKEMLKNMGVTLLEKACLSNGKYLLILRYTSKLKQLSLLTI